ncbi:MAG: hypothetical protein U0526_00075 [Candidatus Saccharibacteria bacterium]
MIDRAYLSIYRALRRVPKRVVVRSAAMVKRRIPAVLGVNRLDEHTWHPIVSTLRSTIEQQAVSRDVDRWGSRTPAAVFYGSLDHLVIAKNVRTVFSHRRGCTLGAPGRTARANKKPTFVILLRLSVKPYEPVY